MYSNKTLKPQSNLGPVGCLKTVAGPLNYNNISCFPVCSQKQHSFDTFCTFYILPSLLSRGSKLAGQLPQLGDHTYLNSDLTFAGAFEAASDSALPRSLCLDIEGFKIPTLAGQWWEVQTHQGPNTWNCCCLQLLHFTAGNYSQIVGWFAQASQVGIKLCQSILLSVKGPSFFDTHFCTALFSSLVILSFPLQLWFFELLLNILQYFFIAPNTGHDTASQLQRVMANCSCMQCSAAVCTCVSYRYRCTI